jgi:hypothetical protein
VTRVHAAGPVRPLRLSLAGSAVGAFEAGGEVWFYWRDLVPLLGSMVQHWRRYLPQLVAPRFSRAMALPGLGQYPRRVFSSAGVRLLCGCSGAPLAGVLFHDLGDAMARRSGQVYRRPHLPVPELPCVFTLLPGPLVVAGWVLSRYAARGCVWLLAQEVRGVPGVSPWALLRRHPALAAGGGVVKMRLESGRMHPRLLLALPVVREMALMCSGPAALALFEVVSEEIAAGRHLFPGGAHGK